ncbi:hypothetical protein AB0J55_04495 [Amycolatopsis sp. NPDC049688]|uniref:hypothetical protein n=1 Tax=Amycolatopsis sp. NPDC049688 TaxID=3154733 RepID=UPI00344650E9
MQHEIRDMIDGLTVAFHKFRSADVPDEAKVQAGRWVAALIGDLSNMAWQLEHNPGRWS